MSQLSEKTFTTKVTEAIDLDPCMLTMLRRLEAATSRLEDMVPVLSDETEGADGDIPPEGAALDTTGGTDSLRRITAPQPLIEPLPPAIDDFDAIINGDVQVFVKLSEEVGGLVAEQVRDTLW